MKELAQLLSQARQFEREAHSILSIHETSKSRVVILEGTYKGLTKLSIKQDDLFRQAMRCAESELYRAAHVMGWAAFMDFFQEKLASDGLKKLIAARPKWNLTVAEDQREWSDFQLIEAAKDVGLCRGKSEVKALHGLLNKRNECAHPSDYYPDLNDAVGYLSELLKRIATLQLRTL